MPNLRVDFRDNSIIDKVLIEEDHIIPLSANFPEDSTADRFIIKLKEIPYLGDLTNFPITISGYTKVLTAPAAGEFFVSPVTSFRPNIIEFNGDDAGDTITVSYYGYGSIDDAYERPFRTLGQNDTIKCYILNPHHHKNLRTAISNINAHDIGKKKIFLKNGTYEIKDDLSLALNTYNVIELEGESQQGTIISITGAFTGTIITADEESVIKNIKFTLGASIGSAIPIIDGLSGTTQIINCIFLNSGTRQIYAVKDASVKGCYISGFIIGIINTTTYIRINGNQIFECNTGIYQNGSYNSIVGNICASSTSTDVGINAAASSSLSSYTGNILRYTGSTGGSTKFLAISGTNDNFIGNTIVTDAAITVGGSGNQYDTTNNNKEVVV